MDPNQMVDELTSMNTLQQVMQMRQDLDTLVGATQSSQGSGGSTGTGAVSGTGTSSASSNAAPSNAISSALNSLTSKNPAAALYSQAISQSQLF